ncbi:hypothetical protein TNCV_1676011 [Trichonephila clavipes]|nr:hypothetical protein TNCV_1676011 [Trichonephila clavipes]
MATGSFTSPNYYSSQNQLLRPSRKEEWGSLKKLTHFYSPLVHWANHVPTRGISAHVDIEGDEMAYSLAKEARTLEPLTSSTTIFDVK